MSFQNDVCYVYELNKKKRCYLTKSANSIKRKLKNTFYITNLINPLLLLISLNIGCWSHPLFRVTQLIVHVSVDALQELVRLAALVGPRLHAHTLVSPAPLPAAEFLEPTLGVVCTG